MAGFATARAALRVADTDNEDEEDFENGRWFCAHDWSENTKDVTKFTSWINSGETLFRSR
jgi:hypothetical protein